MFHVTSRFDCTASMRWSACQHFVFGRRWTSLSFQPGNYITIYYPNYKLHLELNSNSLGRRLNPCERLVRRILQLFYAKIMVVGDGQFYEGFGGYWVFWFLGCGSECACQFGTDLALME